VVVLFRRVLAGLRALLRRDHVERDLDEELTAYFESAVERHMQAGLTHEAAMRAARIEIGSRTALKDHVRDTGWESRLDDVWQDARYAVRTLRHAPGFTIVAVLTLGLAIGANTAIFNVLNGLMLRALPVKSPEQLAMVSTVRADEQGFPAGFNYKTWEQIREHARPLGRAVAWSVFHSRLDLAQGGEADLADGLFVSGNFFNELGVVPLVGRTFTADEDRLADTNSRVAIISHGFWQRRFGGDTGVVGRTILVERVPVMIVGVAPPEFLGPEVGRAFEIALPIGSAPLVLHDEQWGTGGFDPSYLALMLRLAPGQSLDSATAAMRGMHRQIIAATMPPNGVWGENQDLQLKDPFIIVPAAAGTSELRRQYSRAVLTVLVISALVLLIACANIASLLMARGADRHRELSLRLALGAPRRRLIQQLLVESLILAAMGSVLGLLLTIWASDALVSQMSTWFDRVTLDVPLDWRVISFTVLLTIATALFFGMSPAFRASLVTPAAALKELTSSGVGRTMRFRSRGGLVAAQVALSLLLVIAAGLFIRSFERMIALPLGFDSAAVLVVEVNASRTESAPGVRAALYEQLASAVAEVPGVARAAASLNTPANHGVTLVGDFIAPGMPELPPMERRAIVNYVTPDWFRTYGLAIRNGRVIEARDTRQAPLVAVVNDAFARKYFTGAQAIGRTIEDAQAPPGRQKGTRTIVGVVGNIIEQSLRQEAFPTLYLPLAQWATSFPAPPQISLSVRAASASPSLLARGVAERLTRIDRRLAFTFRPLEEQIDAARNQERLIAWLSTFFGALALLLAAVGLFGITSSTVVRRRTEIGIRMALGAQRGDVIRITFRQTILATAAGLMIGVAAAAVLTRYLQAMLFGVTPLDPVTFVSAPALLALVAVIACWLPAHRAATVDPMLVLRSE
jgi:putative ABC transport system permease protein